ncbi:MULTISPECIES: GGDEF domain-containing protein [Sphingomonas]|uniref:diguanylate cyclase n=1 Tax=Sphingomonas trueperi TaxID=53317 RepID=A0A7X6BD62_9SPHN|nr:MULTISPECIES: GGDEF domain-containing protein [Sphingomonas]NJB97561.1 diguanylate cyclase (GGDEF)-like protein [Sphingomonas trueperi]
MMRSFRWTMRLSRLQAWIAVCTAMVVTIVADWATGPTVSMTIGYLFVDILTAWTLRERAGIIVVLFSIALGSALNGFGSLPFLDFQALSAPVVVWNTVTRAAGAIMIVLMVATLRHTIDGELWRASTDYLTRSLNGGAFRSQLERVAQIARRRGSTLLLLYMDLDGFKAVNDRHGHAAGDLVLRRFADEARARMRPDDLFARLGGDEFCAFLAIERGVVPEQVAESLHARLSEALRSTGHAVTCSMGAVVIDAHAARDTERMIGLADEAMLEVKRNGKNAIRIAFDEPGTVRRAA